MSSVQQSATATSTTSSPTPTSTNSGGGGGSDQPNLFYRNLFYILIGLLAAFGLISFISLARARRRRARVSAEASRLGLLVPGMEGYIPLRERRTNASESRWRHHDGRVLPDWWEVEKRKDDGQLDGDKSEIGADIAQNKESEIAYPLAVIPPSISLARPPAPTSSLPYFPHHLAYRPEDLDPLPQKFSRDDNSNLDELTGEQVQIAALIRMPGDPPRPISEVEEGEEILNEWGGIVVGVMTVRVEGGQ